MSSDAEEMTSEFLDVSEPLRAHTEPRTEPHTEPRTERNDDGFSALASDAVPPGSLVVVRDETWLVTSVENTSDGPLYTVRGVSEFVAGIEASFYGSLDDVAPVSPESTTLVADDSPHYRRTRLWLESTLRKTPVPVAYPELTVSTQMMADDLPYQREAVKEALSLDRPRPRLLIADAVGLGKTLEIGMILTELMRRGRGRRLLIVCPRHVLEQMQHEMWVRFAIPFVRLDSEGVQAVKQKLPATRNPFTFFEKVIISMDTMKQDRFVHDLREHRWDAVVIDESHNVTNSNTQNNQLARTLAPNTDALILASATPHNGKNESFAQLLSLLEPTSVAPDGTILKDSSQRLMVRRHRYSNSVKDVVGDKWAPRKDPVFVRVDPSPEEEAVAKEIAQRWTHREAHPDEQQRGQLNSRDTLFAWSLMKGFLSSPPALEASIAARLAKIAGSGCEDNRPTSAAINPAEKPHRPSEVADLLRLRELNDACMPQNEPPRSAKYLALRDLLKKKGVGPTSAERVVVFAERVMTLDYLAENLTRPEPMGGLGLKANQVEILHGGLSDVEQQRIVESFKQEASPIRVLVTGDVASEGVNLHLQCHELVHFDIPWSLIRIEQRNGRIDRYGQRVPPQITALLLDLTDVPGCDGDIRVLEKLLEREKEAHEQLGDSASLMQKYSAVDEENSIRDVLRGAKDMDDVVPSVESVVAGHAAGEFVNPFMDPVFAAMIASGEPASSSVVEAPQESPPSAVPASSDRKDHRAARSMSFATGLFASDSEYLLEGVEEMCMDASRPLEKGGIGLQRSEDRTTITLTPPQDLKKRLEFLPRTYLADQDVLRRFRLTTDKAVAERRLAYARSAASSSLWPDTHYLSPLHPVLEWVADRSLAKHERGTVPVVIGNVGQPWVIAQVMLTAKGGQTVHAELVGVAFDESGAPHVIGKVPPSQLFEEIELGPDTIGTPVVSPRRFEPQMRDALAAASTYLERDIAPQVREESTARAEAWIAKLEEWEEQARGSHAQSSLFKQSSAAVRKARQDAKDLLPERSFVRPLLVAVPREPGVRSEEAGRGE